MARKAKRKVAKDPLWELVDDYYKLGLELRKPFEQQWLLNLQFLRGNQYIYFNKSAFRIEELRPQRGRVVKQDNQILPRVRRQIADAIKVTPEMSVVPATNDSDDIEAAKVGTKVLKSFWQNNRMSKKMRELALWRFATGNAFLDCRWDQMLGKPQIAKDGNLYYEGDVDCGVWSPLEILVPYDPEDLGSNTDLHSFPWMIKVKKRDLGYFQENYGEKGNMVETETLTNSSQAKSRLRKLEGAFLKELYVQPCGKFPKGIFIAAANGVVLHKQDYPFQSYNVEHFIDLEVPGSFWGKATMEDAIPLQVTWNKTLSDFVEFNQTMARGKFLKPKGSKMTALTDEIGQIIEYKAIMGYKPEMLAFKGTPSSYLDILGITKSSLDDLFAQHEISRGTNKSDIRSGEMVSLLREQDAHGNIPTAASFEETLENLMKLVLKRIKDGYADERLLKITGKQKQFEVFSFKGADLRDCQDVYVKKQSSVADSRIARENTIFNRFQGGLYGNPADPEVRRQVMIMLDEAVVDNLQSGVSIEDTLIRWENKVLSQKGLGVNPYDEHGMHVKLHGAFLKGLEIQQMKLNAPDEHREFEIRFLKHMQEHQQFLKEQLEGRIENERRAAGKD